MALSVGSATLPGSAHQRLRAHDGGPGDGDGPIFLLFFTMQKRVIDGWATSGLKG